MKALLFLAVLVLASASNWEQFNDFVLKYNKKYDSLEEMEYRFKVFEANLERIAVKNAEHVAAGYGEVFGVNTFADMTKEEFEVRLMKNLPEPETPKGPTTFVNVIPNGDIDWRHYPTQDGVVSAVKDQGQCGSCWAHSADEAVESFFAIKTNATGKTMDVLSVQQCTACTYNYNGCNGGWPYDAYTYAIKNRNGIDLDADYPYNIASAGVCKFGSGNADKPVTTDTGYKSVAKGNLASALATTGPVSVCVAAEDWQTYTGGILSVCTGQVDHCVQAVGYNTAGATPYWVVRNSWGTGWGVQGYIYLNMNTNSGDICHIQEYITYPLV